MNNSNTNSRRSFLKKGALAAIGVGVLNSLTANELYAGTVNGNLEMPPVDGAFELPKLDYAYGALEPFIDAKTMEIHHSKHHQTYVTKLNEAIEKAPELKGKSLMELVANINAAPESVRTAIRNHGGGHFNHSFFWKLMSPDAKNTAASAELTAAINAKWTSMDNFKVSGFIYSSENVCMSFFLFKISNTGFEDLDILFSVDVHGYGIAAAFAVSHLSKYTTIRACDSFDSCVGTVDVPFFIHGYVSVQITVLGCYLTVCKEFIDPLFVCHETTLSMRRRVDIYFAKFCLCQPWGFVSYYFGVNHLRNMSADGIVSQCR
jgi:hypothetical protein